MRLRELRARFGDGCVDFGPDVPAAARAEALAMASEPLMEQVLSGADPREEGYRHGPSPGGRCSPACSARRCGWTASTPCLPRCAAYTRQPAAAQAFGARVFKIAEDGGARLTYLKVTGGCLHVKDMLESRPDARAAFREKADQLRVYSGSKFRLVSEAWPGDVVAVTGLSAAYPGQGLGGRAGRRAAGAGTGAELPPAAAGRGPTCTPPCARCARWEAEDPAAACRLAGKRWAKWATCS